MEHLLHYVWKHKLFPLKTLQTTDGLPLEVIDAGLHNSDAGPDFFNAKLKIGDTLWVGNVEIHSASSDWYRHGHNRNKTYDSVVLHVAAEVDADIARSDGTLIPQFRLEVPQEVQAHYRELCAAELYPACFPILASLPKLTVHSWLTALQTERLEQKSTQIMERLRRFDLHWEDAFFITLARNYGFGLNGDAFEAWASLLPFRAMEKHRNDLFQIEAFFFGMAGMLEESFLAKEDEDEYSLRMRKEFRYLQHKFGLEKVMDVTLWRFMRLRPDNFPHIRLAQLAYLYQKADKLFSQLLEAETLTEVRRLLATRTSDYWEEHYMFGRLSSRKVRTMGERSLNLIVINTLVPFLYAYGLHKGEEERCTRAGSFLEELKAEDNHIVRSWHAAGLPVATAADSQALIQLRKEYCDKRKCLYCRFGYEYLRYSSERKRTGQTDNQL